MSQANVPSNSPASASSSSTPPVLKGTILSAVREALGGGVPGAAAMAVQVLSLMWLRTVLNYQYVTGTSTTVALRTLYAEGGITRLYRGLSFALLQAPLSRFGDTAANAGVLGLLEANPHTRHWHVAAKTLCASAAAVVWRLGLMPLDTAKTMMQVRGNEGMRALREKYRASGFAVLYFGSAAAAGAAFVQHFPWFFAYNTLNSRLPVATTHQGKIFRSAFIGFVASTAAGVASNSLHILKTARQSHRQVISYTELVQEIVRTDGLLGLFGRGLATRVWVSALQGMLFTVLWREFQDLWEQVRPSQPPLADEMRPPATGTRSTKDG